MNIHEFELWETAKNRASFKPHLLSYIIANIAFWLLWGLLPSTHTFFPWPIYPMIGWGIGLLFHGLKAYKQLGARQVRDELKQLL